MSKKKNQQILIPKGTINPEEDTLIEIPTNLKNQSLVVAKRIDNDHGQFNNATDISTYRSQPFSDTTITIRESSTGCGKGQGGLESDDYGAPPVVSKFVPKNKSNIRDSPKSTEEFSPNYYSTVITPSDQRSVNPCCKTGSDHDGAPSAFTRFEYKNKASIREPPISTEEYSPNFFSTFMKSADQSFNNTTSYKTANTSRSQTLPDLPSLGNLDETEMAEWRILQKRLEDFQQARRELLLGATSVATKSSQFIPKTNFDNDPTFRHRTYSSPRLKPNNSGSSRENCSQEPRKTKRTQSAERDFEDTYSTAHNKSCILNRYNDDEPYVQSIYSRPSKSGTTPIEPQDSNCVLSRKQYVGRSRSHRRSEKSTSKQMQTENSGDDEEEEEVSSCVCSSKSTNSMGKSGHSISKRR